MLIREKCGSVKQPHYSLWPIKAILQVIILPGDLEAAEAQVELRGPQGNNSLTAWRRKKTMGEPLVTICIETTAQQKQLKLTTEE